MIPSDKIITVSAKRMWDTCPRKHFYRYRLGWDAKELAPALERGIEFHHDAEAIHSGDDEADLSLTGLGYKRWQKHDQFHATQTEQPFLLPIPRLYEYIGASCPQPLSDYFFGGVVDAVGTFEHRPGFWLMDHKSVKSFYKFPALYSGEQIGMYAVAWGLLSPVGIAGCIISRVKLAESMHPKRYTNYVMKRLQELDIPVTRAALHGIYRAALHMHSAVPHMPDAAVLHRYKNIVRIPLRPETKDLRIRVQTRSPEGFITLSIAHQNGVLVHVERLYYQLAMDERVNIVSDFLAFVERTYTPQRPVALRSVWRRSPGLHCVSCPFRDPCLEERQTLQDAPGSTLGAGRYQDALVQREANSEVLEALR